MSPIEIRVTVELSASPTLVALLQGLFRGAAVGAPLAPVALKPCFDVDVASAPAPALRPDGGRTIGSVLTWSDERLALLRRLWPSGTPRNQVTAELNALPGPPLLPKQVGRKAWDQGIPRGPPPASDTPAPPREKFGITELWSGERLAVLRAGWPSLRPSADVVAEINALPGQPVRRDQVSSRAAWEKIARGKRAVRPGNDPAPEAEPAPVPTVVEPAVVEPVAAVEPAARPPAAAGTWRPPKVATYGTIQQWAIEHRLGSATHGFDLAAVNARRAELDLVPFRIAKPGFGTASVHRSAP